MGSYHDWKDSSCGCLLIGLLLAVLTFVALLTGGRLFAFLG